MILLKNIRNTVPPMELSKIDSKDYDLVWIADYYDAPLTGLLLIKGNLYWFDCINESDQLNEWFRQYAIVKLTKKELDYQQIMHHDFQKYVRIHWDKKLLTQPPKRVYGQEDKFYDKYLTNKEEYENNEAVSWFEA